MVMPLTTADSPTGCSIFHRSRLHSISHLNRLMASQCASYGLPPRCAMTARWLMPSGMWHNHPAIIKEAAMDRLFGQLTAHRQWSLPAQPADKDAWLALQARDWLIAHHADNPGLAQMAHHLQVDRFRLSRLFQNHWGLPPHAWLVQWRLSQARRQLAQGQPVADVAAALGFADQSHLGRWFKRACQLSPARYQHACTNLPDLD
jgi:AraC-like DNA-binding protein